MKNGLIDENGELVYYKDDVPCHVGILEENGDIYYIGRGGRAIKGQHTIHSSMAHGLLRPGIYQFGEEYKLIKPDETKCGLFTEDGRLRYYDKGLPVHAGVIREGKDIYYIGEGGYAVTGTHVVHRGMTNGILKHGTYTFGSDYKVLPKTYIAPKKKHGKKKKTATINKVTLIIAIALAIITLLDLGFFIKERIDRRNPKSEQSVENSVATDQITLSIFD